MTEHETAISENNFISQEGRLKVAFSASASLRGPFLFLFDCQFYWNVTTDLDELSLHVLVVVLVVSCTMLVEPFRVRYFCRSWTSFAF